MMRAGWVERIAFAVQRVLLVVSHAVHRTTRRDITWVVGPDELASMVGNIADAVPGSYSVSLSPHRFYPRTYDRLLSSAGGPRIASLRRLIAGPWILGALSRRAGGVVYVGAVGFLVSSVDDREFEFAFLRRHGVKIACYFTGDDIRAPRLMHELEQVYGRPNLSTVVGTLDPLFESDEYDALKRRIGAIADRFADVIFTAPVDQRGYLTSDVRAFRYFYPDDRFRLDLEKYVRPERLVLVHAPSAPVLKGTQFVREAIERLRSEGYDFEYHEFTDVSNDEVRQVLSRAHLVLNQFYAYLPGVFGIEALASSCVMLCSADERIEPLILGPGANDAWVVTGPDEVYEHTRTLLEHPESLAEQARRGFEWAMRYASASASAEYVVTALDEVLRRPAS
ncbi:hypothetical protein [Agromyces sp. NPDC049794]|uniref:hypothetical protein n=1 Tax=unclassified Agromyces TaxID=2639701 RepID=UPI00340A2098